MTDYYYFHCSVDHSGLLGVTRDMYDKDDHSESLAIIENIKREMREEMKKGATTFLIIDCCVLLMAAHLIIEHCLTTSLYCPIHCYVSYTPKPKS